MTPPPFTPQELQNLRDFAALWGKIVARRAFGDQGPPRDIDFTTLEQIARAAAQGLTEGTLTTLLQQHAATLPNEVPCPQCGSRCPIHHEERPLHHSDGTLTYREPLAHCPACRRDFFPSADDLAARHP